MTARVAALALGNGRGVYAWWPPSAAAADAARTTEFAFDAGALAAGDDTALADALRTLRRAAPAAHALHVALASPWTSPREVALPPVSEREARAVLTRDAARHFPAVRAEPTVSVRSLGRRTWLACDADGVVLDAIGRGARAAGFTSVRVVPAVGAWARTVTDVARRAFELDGEAAVIGARRGNITSLRRCRAGDLPPDGMVVADVLAVAARYAPSCAERELASERVRAARDAVAMRAARPLVVVGIAMLLVAGGVQAWGASHRVTRLEERRTALRPAVAPYLAARDSLVQAGDALALLARARAQSSVWGRRVWALAAALPDDAYLTALRGDGDSVRVEGRAADAAFVLERFKAVPGVTSVRATSPVAGTDELVVFSAIVRFGDGGAP